MTYECIMDETPLFVINDSKDLSEAISKEESLKYAQIIHNETNVPISSLYNVNGGLFFLDCWHKVNNTWYFFKSDLSQQYFINELLGEKISEYFYLDTTHYKIAKLNNGKCEKIGLASPSFTTFDNTYKGILEYPEIWARKDLKGLIILKIIKEILTSEKQYNALALDIKKFFVRDFLVGEKDRGYRNFLFRENQIEIRLAPLYDYEVSFTDEPHGWYVNSLGCIDINDQELKKEILEDDDFQELFSLLLNIDINKILCNIEEEHIIKISAYYKDLYNKHVNKTKDIVKKTLLR